MEYKRFNDTIIVRLDPKEEICESIMAVAEKEEVKLAEIQGLGALNELTTGVFNTATKEYHANQFQGAFEIVSLTGTITRQKGKVYLHAHLSAGDEKGNVFGGHLNRAVVSATAEIVIRIIDGAVGRKFSEEVGLNLFDFSSEN